MHDSKSKWHVCENFLLKAVIMEFSHFGKLFLYLQTELYEYLLIEESYGCINKL